MTDDPRVRDFLAHVRGLADGAGVDDLDDDQLDELLEASHAAGFTADATEQAFAQLVERDYEDDDDDFDYEEDEEDEEDFDMEDEPDMADDDDGEPDPRLVEDVQMGLEMAQRKLGRSLTNTETERAVRGALGKVQSGHTHAGHALVDAVGDVKPLVDMDQAEHHAFARERAREVYAEANPEPEEIDYDLDTSEGRVAYGRARMAGYEPDPADVPEAA